MRVERKPASTGPCAHCGRVTDGRGGNELWAFIGGNPVCHPDEQGRPDCLRMVAVYDHPLLDCAMCALTGAPADSSLAGVLSGRALGALQAAAVLSGDVAGDVLNRAVLSYALILEVAARGGGRVWVGDVKVTVLPGSPPRRQIF